MKYVLVMKMDYNAFSNQLYFSQKGSLCKILTCKIFHATITTEYVSILVWSILLEGMETNTYCCNYFLQFSYMYVFHCGEPESLVLSVPEYGKRLLLKNSSRLSLMREEEVYEYEVFWVGEGRRWQMMQIQQWMLPVRKSHSRHERDGCTERFFSRSIAKANIR